MESPARPQLVDTERTLLMLFTHVYCLHICAPVGPIQECQQSMDNVMKAMQLLTSQGVHVYRQQ